ncbi:ribbon-helix-helix domain-containing protein [Halopolyspora algeriensis]|nr:ribbon-helix-helix domain-containing protein [Halopolyspora algeriensis]
MTKQIAVRLPDALVEFIDEHVEHGEATSRADFVAHALERQRRREVAARDAAILAQANSDTDLDSLADHAARVPMDDLD